MAAKATETKLGGDFGNLPCMAAMGAKSSGVALSVQSRNRAKDISLMLLPMRREGPSLRHIAARLKGYSILALRGAWPLVQVSRVLKLHCTSSEHLGSILG